MNSPILSIILLIASLFIASSIQSDIPKCIQSKINDISAQSVWNPPARISKYFYGNQITYLFSANCCDQFNSLYDESCNHICAPSGGFTGRGDMKCTDFNENAKFMGQVWVDSRPRNQ